MAQNKGISLFWKIYIAIAALLFAALGIWLVFLYGWLDKQEAAQPKYYAANVVETEFKKRSAEELVNAFYNEKEGGLPINVVIRYIESIIEGKELSFKRTSSDPKKGIKYIVTAGTEADAERVASFVLVENKKGGYEAKEHSLYVDKSLYKESVTAEIPKGYTLIVNGETIGSQYIIEDNIETESCQYMPEGVEGLMFTKYKVDYLAENPVVEIRDKSGNVVSPEITDEGYKVTVPYDEELQAEYSEWIIEGAELYSRYTQFDEKINVVYFSQIAPWFDPSSDLYESIRTMENGFVEYYDDFEFTDKSATEFIKYDENTFSCHIKLTQIMYKTGTDPHEDYIDLILYLRRVDGNFLIYNMKVN